MPTIAYDSYVPWANYHLTTGTCRPPSLEPDVKVERLGRFHAADVGGIETIERFAATTGALWRHVRCVIEQMVEKRVFHELGDPPKPFPAALVGRGWSFSHLIGADRGKDRESLLLCDGLAGSILLAESDLETKTDAGSIVLTGGGTRLRELLEWAARLPQPRSIRTSGTHLGMTVAGAVGTSSHGSRLDFGGIQNMVVGMHLVTGLGDSVWIEAASRPVLTDAAAARLNPDPTAGQVRVIRDDRKFEDALVHYGCMGIVNCVALELGEDSKYDVFLREQPITDDWIAWVGTGDWDAIAAWLGETRKPVFYEATLNPHDWRGASALHTLYFEKPDPMPTATVDLTPENTRATVADAVASFAKMARPVLAGGWTAESHQFIESFLAEPLTGDPDDDSQKSGVPPPPVPIRMFDPRSCAQSIYEYYREIGKFTADGAIVESGTWREIHRDEITGGIPGSLYNRSYAIPREELGRALPLIAAAVEKLPLAFVFTVRFVSGAKGAMAFTRFPECAVIEIDGLSPWICEKIKLRLDPADDTHEDDLKLLDLLKRVLPGGADLLAETLDAAKIDYSSHFAKRGYLDKRKIQHDFGPLDDPQSRLASWRRTRDEVLASDHGRAMFWNWGAVNFGLLDAPTEWPADVPERLPEETEPACE